MFWWGFSLIKGKIEEIKGISAIGDYRKALEEYLLLVSEENRDALPVILDEIRRLVMKGIPLYKNQLEIIRPFIDDYEEQNQRLALEICTGILRADKELFSDEFNFCVEKLSDFEPLVRDKMGDLLISSFNFNSDRAPEIIEALVDQILVEEHWKIRMKILDFLNKVFKQNSSLLVPYKGKLEALTRENDLDVSRETRDFLFRFMQKHYSKDDLENLFLSLPKVPWGSQKMILWLIGHLGITRADLVAPFFQDLIDLLDHDIFELQKAVKTTLIDVAIANPGRFDDYFIQNLAKGTTENIESLEKILVRLVETRGFDLLFSIYQKIDSPRSLLLDSFTSIVKKLVEKRPGLAEEMIGNLLDTLFNNFQDQDREKLEVFFRRLPRSQFFFTAYFLLKDGHAKQYRDGESNRNTFLEFIQSFMPDLEERYNQLRDEVEIYRREVREIFALPDKLDDVLQVNILDKDINELKEMIDAKFFYALSVVEEFDAKIKHVNPILFATAVQEWNSIEDIIPMKLQQRKDELLQAIKSKKAAATKELTEHTEQLKAEIDNLYHDYLEYRKEIQQITANDVEDLFIIVENLGRIEAIRARIWQIEMRFNEVLEKFPKLPHIYADLILFWTNRKKEIQLSFYILREKTENLIDEFQDSPEFRKIQEELKKDHTHEKLQNLQLLIASSYKKVKTSLAYITRILGNLDEIWGTPKISSQIFIVEQALNQLKEDMKQFGSQIFQMRSNIDFNRLSFVDPFHDSITTWNNHVETATLQIKDLLERIRYLKIGEFIRCHITVEPIQLNLVQAEFNIEREELINILNHLISEGKLAVVLRKNKIKLPSPRDFDEASKYLAIFKRFSITQDSMYSNPVVNLQVKIEATTVKLSQISVFLKLPGEFFQKIDEKAPMYHFRPSLTKGEFFVLSWAFQKNQGPVVKRGVANLEMVLFFNIDGKFQTLIKNIEILLL